MAVVGTAGAPGAVAAVGVAQVLSYAANVVVAAGVIVALWRVQTAVRASRTTAFLTIFEKWSSDDLYKAVGYVHDLRRRWKAAQPDHKLWKPLAQQWVEEHVAAIGCAVSD